MSKTTTSHVHHTFLYISLPLLHDNDLKLRSFAFMENVNKQRRNFISLSELGYSPRFTLNSTQEGSPTFDKVSR